MPPARGVKKTEDENRILVNRYRVERRLGSGNYGTVFLVRDLKTPNQVDEMKVVKEMSVSDLQPDEHVDAMREARLLSKLDHPNIVTFYDSFIDNDFFCLVTDFCEGGDLEDTITACKKAGKKIEAQTVMDWFCELSLAVEYMHRRKVLHRDLKARNIFMKHNHVKIGDFGISRVLMGTVDMASTFVGTPYYMSPEVLKHEGYNDKSDVWSIGCILYEMCSLRHAFEGQSLMGVMYKIVEGKIPLFPKTYKKEIADLFKWMLSKDPGNRPSACEVIKNKFVSEHIEKMKTRTVPMRDSRPEMTLAGQEAQEISALFRQKTTLGELKEETLERTRIDEEMTREMEDKGYEIDDEWQKMTPSQKLKLRKQQEADRKGQELTIHARQNARDNMIRKAQASGTLRSTNPAPWASHNNPANVANRTVGYYELPEEPYFAREHEMGTVVVSKSSVTQSHKLPSSDDRPIHRPAAYNEPPGTNQDRPITPQKNTRSIDERIAQAQMMEDSYVPSGLTPKKPFHPLKKGQGRTSLVGTVVTKTNKRIRGRGDHTDSGAPSDAEAAYIYYTQDGFEPYSDDDQPNSDDDAMADELERALNLEDTVASVSQIKPVVYLDAYSPYVKENKIKNMRGQCETKFGKENFKNAYEYLKTQLAKQAKNPDLSHEEIAKGVSKFCKNPQDGFLLEQLVFLEMSPGT